MIGLPNLGHISLRALLLQRCQAPNRDGHPMCGQPTCRCQQECSTSENPCLAILPCFRASQTVGQYDRTDKDGKMKGDIGADRKSKEGRPQGASFPYVTIET